MNSKLAQFHPKLEPALYAGGLSSILAFLVAIRFHGLSTDQASLIVAAFAAVSGAVTSVFTRPLAPGLITGAVTALFDLAAGFHFSAQPDVIAAVNGVVLFVLSVLTSTRVSPTSRTGR